MNKYEKLYEKYKQEAIEELEECGLKWDDHFLEKDYSPDFDYEEEYHLRFNLALGKMLILWDIINNRI